MKQNENNKDPVSQALQEEQPPSRGAIEKACKLASASTPPEILLLCAEMASEQTAENVNTSVISEFIKHANHCLELYHTATASASLPLSPDNTFRVSLVESQLEIAGSQQQPLKTKIEKTVQVLTLISQGLETVHKSRALIYNTSIVFWRIVRSVMLKEGCIGQIVVPLKAMCKSLDEAFPDSLHSWRSRLHMTLARSQDDIHRQPEAASAAQQAYQLSMKCKEGGTAATTALRMEAVRLLVHICKGSQETLTKLRNELATPAQKELKAHALIQMIQSSATHEQKAAQDLKDVFGQAATSKSDELLSLAATVAASQPASLSFAIEATQKLRASKNLKARAIAGLVRCELALHQAIEKREASHPGSSTCIGSTDATDKKVFEDILAQLVGIIDGAVRHHSASAHPSEEFPSWGSVVEDGVALVWKTVLPMLSHHRKGQTKAALLASSAALQAISSTDLDMAKRLHQEIARCELAEDNPQRAAVHAKLAAAIDANDEEAADLTALLRADAQRDQSSLPALERSQIALSKAKDLLSGNGSGTVNRGLSRELLMSAIGLLESSPPTRGRALILHSVVLEASRAGFVEVVRRGHVLWYSASNTEFFSSAEGQRLTVEIVYAYGSALVQSSPAASIVIADYSTAPIPDVLDEAQLAGVREICRGARIAAKAAEALLVTNGTVLVWSALAPWIHRGRWTVVREHLQNSFVSLAELNIKRVDSSVTGPLCVALLRCILELGSASQTEDFQPAMRSLKQQAQIPATDIALADEVVKLSYGLHLSAVARREISAMVAKLNVARGGNGTTPQPPTPIEGSTERDQNLVISLEALAFETPEQKHRESLHKLLPLIANSMANIQPSADDAYILGRTAIECLELGEYDAALNLASQGSSLLPTSAISAATRDQLRWVAICKFVVGKALLRDTKISGPALTGSLAPAAFRASLSFAEAVTLVAKSHEPELLVRFAHAFWTACAPLSQTRAIRKLLGEPLEVVARAAAASGRCPDELLARLYCLALECITERAGLASRGTDLADEALRRLPKQYHQEIWRSKAMLLTTSGSGSVTPEMLGANEEDAVAQALLFARIALSSSSTSEDQQQLWMDRALQALQQHPLERAEFLLQYVSWMISHGRAASSIDAIIRDGVSRLRTSLEPPLPAPSQLPTQFLGSSPNTALSSSRRSSRASSRASSRPSPRRAPAAVTVDVKAPLCFDEKMSIPQADKMRYWIVLSKLYCYISLISPACILQVSELTQFVMLSHEAMMRVWAVILGHSTASMSLDDWCNLDILKLQPIPATILTSWTNLVWHCRMLSNILAARGAPHFGIPSLYLIQLVVHCLPPDVAKPCLLEAIKKRNLTMLGNIFDQCGMESVFGKVHQEMGTELPSQQSLNAVQQQEKQLEALEHLAHNATDISANLTKTDAAASRAQSRAKALNLSDEGVELSRMAIDTARDLTVEEEWMETAKILITQGQYSQAKRLASESMIQARLHSDKWTEGWCSHILATIADIEHFADYSTSLEQEAIKLAGSDVELLAESSSHILGLPGDRAKKLIIATNVLHAIEKAFNATPFHDSPAFIQRKTTSCIAKLSVLIAKESPMSETQIRADTVRLVISDIQHGGNNVEQLLETALMASKLTTSTLDAHSLLSNASEIGSIALSLASSGSLLSQSTMSTPIGRILACVHTEIASLNFDLANDAAKRAAETTGMNVVERYLATSSESEEIPATTI